MMMKKLNRRSFLKSVGKTIGGVLGLGVVGLPKAKAVKEPVMCLFPGPLRPEYRHKIHRDIEAPNKAELISVERGVWTGIRFIETEDTIQEWEPAEIGRIWRNRKFLFKGRRIRWSEEGEYDNFPECNYLDLPTIGEIWAVDLYDYGFILGFFIGNERWKLKPDNDSVMRVERISNDPYLVVYAKGEGARFTITA